MIPSTLSEYWQAVAQAINAEDRKASLFLKDKHARGIAREAILRLSVATHTPEPFKVETGFICNIRSNTTSSEAPELWHSRQCDVLVYDPHVARPYYSFDKLAVVSRWAATAVVEVKTDLKRSTLNEILGVWEHTSWVPVPTFGFAFSGWSFSTFLAELAVKITTNPVGVPECIAVHRRNYVFVRSAYTLAQRAGKPHCHRPAKYQLAIDFGEGKEQEGAASACFFERYQQWLVNRATGNDHLLPVWFNRLQLPKEAKVSINDEGALAYGQVTVA